MTQEGLTEEVQFELKPEGWKEQHIKTWKPTCIEAGGQHVQHPQGWREVTIQCGWSSVSEGREARGRLELQGCVCQGLKLEVSCK